MTVDQMWPVLQVFQTVLNNFVKNYYWLFISSSWPFCLHLFYNKKYIKIKLLHSTDSRLYCRVEWLKKNFHMNNYCVFIIKQPAKPSCTTVVLFTDWAAKDLADWDQRNSSRERIKQSPIMTKYSRTLVTWTLKGNKKQF